MHSKKIHLFPKPNPAKWAEALILRQTRDEAYRIVEGLKRPFLGKDNDVVNTSAGFYLKAYAWMCKHHPKA